MTANIERIALLCDEMEFGSARQGRGFMFWAASSGEPYICGLGKAVMVAVDNGVGVKVTYMNMGWFTFGAVDRMDLVAEWYGFTFEDCRQIVEWNDEARLSFPEIAVALRERFTIPKVEIKELASVG